MTRIEQFQADHGAFCLFGIATNIRISVKIGFKNN